MGLANLTKSQLVELFTWSMKAQAKATDKGVQDAKGALPLYSCHTWRPSVPSAKVRVLLNADNEQDAEIVSGVRERLRNMSDVEIVYSRDDADLDIGLLASEVKNRNGDKTGYVVAMVAGDACKVTAGDMSWPVTQQDASYLQVSGSNVHEAVEQAVSTLDAHDLEGARKRLAALKKQSEQVQQTPKP